MADEENTPEVPETVPAHVAKAEEPKNPKRDLGPAQLVRNRDVVNEDPERDRIRASGGVFLDDIQRRDAEVLRAKAEKREPDLDNPPPIVSTDLRDELSER